MKTRLAPVLSSLLDGAHCVRHGFFTREGGVSDGLYASLNCGLGTKDAGEHVFENRARITDHFSLPQDALVSLAQIHGRQVVSITSPEQTADAHGSEADALVTNQPDILLGIVTADCAPVLFADPKARVVGAAHAGWKGAVGGVLPETLNAMMALGAHKDHIIASIGPCIAQSSYEVDTAFYQRFITADSSFGSCFSHGQKPAHYQFDLALFIRKQLDRLGIRQVDLRREDTYANESRFFSFRRATHREEPDYGRQLSVVGLMP